MTASTTTTTPSPSLAKELILALAEQENRLRSELNRCNQYVDAYDSPWHSPPAVDCAEAWKQETAGLKERLSGTGERDRHRDGTRSQSAATKSLLRRRSRLI